MLNKIRTWGLVLVLAFVAVYVVYGMTAGNQSLQKKAAINLNEYVDSGAEFPMGEYVSCDVRWVLGPFATNTEYTTWGITQVTNRVDNYYFLVLEDMTLMTLCASDKATVEKLNAMSDWLSGVNGFPMSGETFTVQGELRRLTDSELRDFFTSDAKTVFGLDADDEAMRYVVLNTNSGTERFIALVAAGVVLIIAAVALITRRKKPALAPNIPET